MPAVPKYKPYRNKKILEFAKGKPCQNCGKQDGTVVAAHSNLMSDGKGTGKKSDDCFTAYLCAECHGLYDRGMMTQISFDQAMKKTWKLLLENGVLK
jgi:hypothetical protein